MNQKNILIAIVALIIIGVGGYFAYGSLTQHSGPVAVVNGEEVSQEDYNFIKDQIKEQSSLQGQDVSGEQLQQQALDQVIAQTLISQKAEEAGITVTEEEIDSQYQNVVSRAGGEEAINKVLSDLGISVEFIRNDIREQLAIQKYVNNQAEEGQLEVTDTEVSDFYSQFASGQENAPALEDIESQIRTQLKNQKQGQLVSQIVSQLRENAEIEILL